MKIKTTIFIHRPCVSLTRFSFCWWCHNLLLLLMTSQWPDNCDAITWKMISKSWDSDFIHSDIHGQSCKNSKYPIIICLPCALHPGEIIPCILSELAQISCLHISTIYPVSWGNCGKSPVILYTPCTLYWEGMLPISSHPFATLNPVSWGNLPYHPMPTMYPVSWRGCSLQNVAERFTSVGRNLEPATASHNLETYTS